MDPLAPNTPRVSVLMAAYNGDDFLAQAIESIHGQTFENWELVVIDDGSTDRTSSILAEAAHNDPRMRVVRQDTNTGLTRALNRAIDMARGEILARHDADDVSRPDRLRRQVDFLDAHPEIGIVGSNYHEIDEAGRSKALVRPPADHTAIRALSVYHSPFCHSSVAMRRSALEPLGALYDEALRYSQDMDLWRRLLAATRGANLPEPLVGFRRHDARISSAKHEEQQRIADSICERALADLLPDRSFSSDEIARLRRFYHRLPEAPTRDDLALCRVFFDVLDALTPLSDIDAARIAELKRHRARLILNQAPLSAAPRLVASGLMGRMLRDAWRAFPQHAADWMRRRARAGRATE